MLQASRHCDCPEYGGHCNSPCALQLFCEAYVSSTFADPIFRYPRPKSVRMDPFGRDRGQSDSAADSFHQRSSQRQSQQRLPPFRTVSRRYISCLTALTTAPAPIGERIKRDGSTRLQCIERSSIAHTNIAQIFQYVLELQTLSRITNSVSSRSYAFTFSRL